MEYSGLATLALALLISGLLLNLFRGGYGFLGVSLCRHPALAGIVIWLITGNTGLLLAALFFELFWLDLFNVGTYVPPDSMFSYLVFAPFAYAYGLNTAPEMAAVMLCCLPLAGVYARAEQLLRERQTAEYHKLNAAITAGVDIEKNMRLVFKRSFARILFRFNLLYAVAVLYLFMLTQCSLKLFGSIYSIPWVSWSFLFCFAAVGGFLSLRIPQAFVCFIACVVVVGGIFIFGF